MLKNLDEVEKDYQTNVARSGCASVCVCVCACGCVSVCVCVCYQANLLLVALAKNAKWRVRPYVCVIV